MIIEKAKSMPEETKNKILARAWEQISDEMTSVSLKDPNYVNKLNKEKRKILRKIKSNISRTALDKTLLLIQEDSESDIKTDFDLWQSLVHLSRYMGFRIDPKQTTITEYLNIINSMKSDGSKKN